MLYFRHQQFRNGINSNEKRRVSITETKKKLHNTMTKYKIDRKKTFKNYTHIHQTFKI